MNVKVLTLFSLSIAFISAMIVSQPAMAQNRGARFTFAPNIYKVEGHNAPRAAQMAVPQQAHTVSHGAVPKGGSNFLGLDSGFLAQPSNHATATVAAHPTMTAGTPRLMPSAHRGVKATPYHNDFGKPHAKTAQAGKLPPAAVTKTTAKRVASKAAPKSIRAKHSVRSKSRSSSKPHRVANTKPAIASYGNSKHFQKGAFTDGISRSSRSVQGKVLKHGK